MMIQGKAWYAKIVGAPKPGYDKSKREWSLDVCVDDATRKLLAKEGVAVRNKGDDRGDFITFKRPEFKQDGNPAKPIEIVDHRGQPWDKRLIGNGSVVNVKFVINENTYNGRTTKKPGLIKLQVWDLVPYEGKGGGEYEETEFPTRETENWADA
jgi:hypothetical protein